MLKEELNRLLNVMEDYSQLQEEVNKTHSINAEIQKKVKGLEDELRVIRAKVEQSEINDEKYRQEQNKLFLRIEELENEAVVLKEKLHSVQQ